MKITLLTYGSRGDVQPFVALAKALVQGGHEVRLAGPGRFATLASEHGVDFVPLAGDPEEISRRINDAGANPLRMIIGMRDYVQAIAAEVARAAFAACRDAELIVHSFLFTTGAHSLARQMGIPDVSAQLFPVFLPTREFPNVAVPDLPPGPLSYLSHWLASQAFWHGGNSGYGRLRRRHPEVLPSRLYWPFDGRAPGRTLYLGGWSPSVLPAPRDWPASRVEITGYWFLDPPGVYQPPAELADFLAAGEPPVCVSFGSMIHRQVGRIAAGVVEALSRAGERAVVLTGWQEWEVIARPEILLLGDAPHGWLFPRCKTVVHHGGAGTTAAAAGAGIPAIVAPFAADQLFWARRMHALGVAPEPVRIQGFSAAWLEGALRQTASGELRRRAAQLGWQIRAEDGAGRAAELVGAWAARSRVETLDK